MDKISIIVPCYNEEDALPEFYRAASDAVRDIDGSEYEFIFVDDGSTDHTPDILESLSMSDGHCRSLSFSRNFGKEAAMYAGLQNACGDYCVFMDADLQHPPRLLKEMYRVLKTEGYDCCAGLREDRTGESRLRGILSRTFYRIIRRTCHLDMGDGKGDFRMMNRAVADAILKLPEYNRYMKGIFSFVGFETKWIPFHDAGRTAGATKWSFSSLFRYAVDGILSFSSAPAALSGMTGALLIIIAVVAGIWMLAAEGGLSGIPLLVCLILLLNGIQMMFISIVGQYAARDYMESKHRPIYIVKKRRGFP
ncbi:MAG TPA: glycosyltransferase family 2 protein [Candidatus Mediterraneibacter excrementavium]|nr:glycosyltransferase family 2 protein [Candidatus Mediterraneibacter excrementavium]